MWHIVLGAATEQFSLSVDGEVVTVRNADKSVILRDAVAERVDTLESPVPSRYLRATRSRIDGEAPAVKLPGGAIETRGRGGAVWRSGSWYYAAIGKDAARGRPEVLVRLMTTEATLDDKLKVRLTEWPGTLEVDAQGTTVVADDAFVIARLWSEPMIKRSIEGLRLLKATRIGAEAPELSVQRWINSSRALTLTSLKGKPVLIDFWGVWCKPCLAAIPAVTALSRDFKKLGGETIAIHTTQASEQLDSFLTTTPYPVPIGVDTGRTQAMYGVNEFPQYVVIDANGRIQYRGSELPTLGKLRLIAAGDTQAP
jgi:thiol-disulfide isomerase/thioredoxin